MATTHSATRSVKDLIDLLLPLFLTGLLIALCVQLLLPLSPFTQRHYARQRSAGLVLAPGWANAREAGRSADQPAEF